LLVLGDFVYHVDFWNKFGVAPTIEKENNSNLKEKKIENLVDRHPQVSFENVLMKKIEKKKDSELKIESLQRNSGNELNLVQGSIEPDFCLFY
jgi:hypothetical protein